MADASPTDLDTLYYLIYKVFSVYVLLNKSYCPFNLRHFVVSKASRFAQTSAKEKEKTFKIKYKQNIKG